jgi:hypothetical protein
MARARVARSPQTGWAYWKIFRYIIILNQTQPPLAARASGARRPAVDPAPGRADPPAGGALRRGAFVARAARQHRSPSRPDRGRDPTQHRPAEPLRQHQYNKFIAGCLHLSFKEYKDHKGERIIGGHANGSVSMK